MRKCIKAYVARNIRINDESQLFSGVPWKHLGLPLKCYKLSYLHTQCMYWPLDFLYLPTFTCTATSKPSEVDKGHLIFQYKGVSKY